MKIRKMLTYPVLLLSTILVFGCTSKKGGDNHAAEDKGEPVQITAYSAKSEAFLDFIEPVAGEKGALVIKLTRLADWKPVSEGALRLVFTPATGAPVELTVPAPERPGIYHAELTLAAAGEYALVIMPQGKGFEDRIEIPELHVLKKGEVHGHTGEQHGAHEGKDAPHSPGEKEAGHGHDGKEADGHKEKEAAHEGKEATHKEKEAGHGHEEGAAHREKGAAQGHHEKEAGHEEEAGHGHGEEAGHEKEGEHHAEADHDHEAHTVITGTGGGTIAFSKEQQWGTEFMTRPAEVKALAGYVSTMGELVPVSNAEAIVSAPLSGIISGQKSLPFVGRKVSKGEVVALIEPPVRQEGGIGELTAGWAEAKNRVLLAQKEYDRAKRLYDAKIAPLKRVEEAELNLSSAKAALAPLEKALESVKGDAGNRIAVRAPISGTVVEVAAANGKGVEAGQPILRIINTGTIWLKAHLPAADAGKTALAQGATFTVTGMEGEFRPSRLVTVNDMLDPQTRTLPVIYEVPNPGGRLKVGMYANVSLRTGLMRSGLAVPREALVEDEGRWFLFIQTSAESFERREVKVGAQDKGYALITEGLKDHERVVTKGVYYVKLAATAGKGVDPHAGHGH